MSRKISRRNIVFLALAAGAAIFIFVCFFYLTYFSPVEYDRGWLVLAEGRLGGLGNFSNSQLSVPSLVVSHIKTPKAVRAIYLSSWTASSKVARNKLLNRIKGTEINSIVIDVKDETGKILVDIDSPTLGKYRSMDGRVSDIKEFIDYLHKHNYYIIARISVFRDDFLIGLRPDLALKKSDSRETWRDNKGIAWLDPSSKEVWDYAVTVAKESYSAGFDEVNFDFVRFPSDGKVSNIFYPYYDPSKRTKQEALEDFFSYLHMRMKELGAPTSANLFGMVTTNTDDLGVGQVLEKAAPYFDYVSPMIYPSQYPMGFRGVKNPPTHPYEIVKYSLDSGSARLTAASISSEKLRPWLQDFNIGAVYTADMVRAEKKAVYDSGLSSWMMWDSSNTYTVGAYDR